MLEYTLACILVFVFIIALDKWMLRTHLLHFSNTRLLKTSAVFLLFQLLFDNYFTWKGLWVFDPHAVIGIFLPFIPLENLFFGLELLWMSILLYHFFTRVHRVESLADTSARR